MIPASFPRLRAICLLLLLAPGLFSATRVVASADGTSPSTDELLAKARTAFAATNFTVAESCYEEVLRRDRTHLTAMLELSNVYERTGKLEYARGLLIRATRIDPGYAAIQERRRAIDAKLAATLAVEVDSLLARGDYDAAVPKLSLHNAIDPGNPSVHYKRAVCLHEMGRHQAALSDLEVAIAASPEEPYFLLRDRIRRDMQQAEIERLAARVRRLSGTGDPFDREEARDLLARIIEIDPEHEWARAETARLEQDAAPPPAVDTSADWKDTLAALTVVAGEAGRFARRHLTTILVVVIVFVVFRSPLSGALARRLRPAHLLSGDLSRFSVAEVLTMLNAEPHTGVLDIRARSGRGRVYFEGGEPRHCVAGRKKGVDALLALIEGCESGRFSYREEPATATRTIDTPLSILLVEQAHRANGVTVRPGIVTEKKSRMKELLDSRIEA